MDAGFPWWILLVVVLVGLISYVAFMIFLPEWVGITGKTAIANELAASGDTPESETNPAGLTNPAEAPTEASKSAPSRPTPRK